MRDAIEESAVDSSTCTQRDEDPPHESSAAPSRTDEMADPASEGSPETKRISSQGLKPLSEARARVARADGETPDAQSSGAPRYVISQNTFPITHARSHALNEEGSHMRLERVSGQGSTAKEAKPSDRDDHQRQPRAKERDASRRRSKTSRAAPADEVSPPDSTSARSASSAKLKSTPTARIRR